MSNEELRQIMEELNRLRLSIEKLIESRENPSGLIGYRGLQKRLAIDGKEPCLRKVKSLVSRNRSIIRPVVLGHTMIGFRPTRVEALLAHLAQDETYLRRL